MMSVVERLYFKHIATQDILFQLGTGQKCTKTLLHEEFFARRANIARVKVLHE